MTQSSLFLSVCFSLSALAGCAAQTDATSDEEYSDDSATEFASGGASDSNNPVFREPRDLLMAGVSLVGDKEIPLADGSYRRLLVAVEGNQISADASNELVRVSIREEWGRGPGPADSRQVYAETRVPFHLEGAAIVGEVNGSELRVQGSQVSIAWGSSAPADWASVYGTEFNIEPFEIVGYAGAQSIGGSLWDHFNRPIEKGGFHILYGGLGPGSWKVLSLPGFDLRCRATKRFPWPGYKDKSCSVTITGALVANETTSFQGEQTVQLVSSGEDAQQIWDALEGDDETRGFSFEYGRIGCQRSSENGVDNLRCVSVVRTTSIRHLISRD